MRKIYFVFLIIPILTLGQNILSIDNISGKPGDTVDVYLNIKNQDSFVGFQCDIVLPKRVEYIENSARLSSRAEDHSLSPEMINDTTLRLLSYSVSQEAFRYYSGAVAYFKVKLGTQPGHYPIIIQDGVIGNSQSENIISNIKQGLITILAPNIRLNKKQINFGEVLINTYQEKHLWILNNGTIKLDIIDINSTKDCFTLPSDSSFSINPNDSAELIVRFKALQKDTYQGRIIVKSNDYDNPKMAIDIVGIGYAINELNIEDLTCESGDKITLPVSIKNVEKFVGFSFDLIIPEKIRYVSGSTNLTERKVDHSIKVSKLDDDNLRLICYSNTNAAFQDSCGTVLNMDFIVNQEGRYKINFQEPIIANNAAQNILTDTSNAIIIVKPKQSSIQINNNTKPEEYNLKKVYPNPFNAVINIEFALPEKNMIKINIFDVQGKHITTLVNQSLSRGNYSAQWSGLDNDGNRVSTGLYLCSLRTEKYKEVKKIVYVK